MKKQFFDYLIELMKDNEDIFFLSGGLGWPRTEDIKRLYPDRYIQCEASEQTMLDVAVGLSYAGKIPIVYTITPFLYRGFETIRTYINHEKLHVIMVGVGRHDDYSKHDGYSHDAKDDDEIFRVMDNIAREFPDNEREMKEVLKEAIAGKEPAYINIPR